MNPFTSIEQTKNDLKLNVWDWSHDFHFTTEIGRITPCFCARVPAKNSLSISARHAEQFMPMMFPVQNSIKARISFFKISIRALWKNYMDWISSVNQVDDKGNPINSRFIPPFVSISTDENNELFTKFNEFFGTCSNLDYLDLPTTYDSAADIPGDTFLFDGLMRSIIRNGSNYTFDSVPAGNNFTAVRTLAFNSRYWKPWNDYASLMKGFEFDLTFTGTDGTRVVDDLYSNQGSVTLSLIKEVSDNSVVRVYNFASTGVEFIKVNKVSDDTLHCVVNNLVQINHDFDLPETFNYTLLLNILPTLGNVSYSINTPITFQLTDSQPVEGAPYDPAHCPWYNQKTKTGLQVSSLPLRFFEAIYNCFYRNDRNNPLSVSGVKKYNDWVLCRDQDGDDSKNYSALSIDGEESPLEYFYGRKYVNWSPDQFTTAVQSPQEGKAPLVGLTTYVTTTNEDGQQVSRLNSVLTDENGDSYGVEFDSDEAGINGIRYTKTDQVQGKAVETLYDAVSQGVSIEDFRQVNAYQRYLELNMRRGYSYKDIIEGRYDVNIRYNELLMPEFCGGFTRDVNVSPVTQTTPTDESGNYVGSLGSQAGQGFVSGQNEGDINIFCDEDSLIMGLYVCYPEAVYTQHLPKHFLINNPLDIFSPEFANIGFQPITLKEIAPIQAFNNDKNSLNNVFGYQRPWYDMLERVSTAHGLYRTQLRNFLMNRVFDGVPALSKNFLFVKPDQVNDVFSVTETTDKIFGMIRFNIRCKNSVPRNNVPRIE